MASREAVREALKFLSGANPAAYVRESTPAAYEEVLSDVTDAALREASRMDWGRFPGAHELRRSAIDLQRYGHPSDLAEDDLMAELEGMWQGYFAGDVLFDAQAWESLAHRFEGANRGEMAALTRRKAAFITSLEAVPV